VHDLAIDSDATEEDGVLVSGVHQFAHLVERLIAEYGAEAVI
jgi:hypothetical protein